VATTSFWLPIRVILEAAISDPTGGPMEKQLAIIDNRDRKEPTPFHRVPEGTRIRPWDHQAGKGWILAHGLSGLAIPDCPNTVFDKDTSPFLKVCIKCVTIRVQ
jgi:hypothetical protein